MGLSIWQIAIVVLLLVLLFGRGKISDLMGDVAKGIKSFKKGMSEDQEEAVQPEKLKTIDQKSDIDLEDNKDKKSKKTSS